MPKYVVYIVILICFVSQTTHSQNVLSQSDKPPIIPVGEDAYLNWERLPYQRIAMRAYMRSTYDRQGNNRGADASHFLYQESDSFNVTLDVRGKGLLYFMRTNHFHGSPWHYETDGNDFIVKETATDDPLDAKKKYLKTEFIPSDIFPKQLSYTWTTTKGADLMWNPIPFSESLRIAYSRTFYGTGYYIYHLFPNQITHISQEINSWNQEVPSAELVELIDKSGGNILSPDLELTSVSGQLSIEPLSRNVIIDKDASPAMIREILFTTPIEQDFEFGKCRLLITWDHRWHASIDAPVDLFFGSGLLYNDNNREYLVKGFPLSIRYGTDSVYLSCYWPMPFFEHVHIELEEQAGKRLKDIKWKISTVPFEDPVNQVSYFHASYTDIEYPEQGKDITFLDTEHREGGGDWSGNFVGMSWIFSHDGILSTLEGDPRFFFDDSNTPQGWGTGTEEWGGGGDYWGGENMTIPFAGHPVGKSKENAENQKQLINSAYRFLIADYFPFGKRALIKLEHGGLNSYPEHYSGVVYWYGMDAPTLILTDMLNVCHPEDRKRHRYSSPTAGKPYSLVSRFEWGPDSDEEGWGNPEPLRNFSYVSRQYFPAQEDSVRIMSGTSSFRVKLYPANQGVLIRRKFDYAYPNQHAKVYAKAPGTGEWEYAGDWYTAGSNTCVYSRPGGANFSEAELKPAQHNIITSNRRWREEEFLIASDLTRGLDSLDIKIVHVPENIQLFPGHDFPNESFWSESRYTIYCYALPVVDEIIRKGAHPRF